MKIEETLMRLAEEIAMGREMDSEVDGTSVTFGGFVSDYVDMGATEIRTLRAEVERHRRLQPLDRDDRPITQSVANGLMALIDELRVEVEKLRRERKTLMDGIGAVEEMLETGYEMQWVGTDEDAEDDDRAEWLESYERAIQLKDAIITEVPPPPKGRAGGE